MRPARRLAPLASVALLQGAIIIVGVAALLDYPEFIYLWKVNKLDFVVWNVAFLFTIFLVGRGGGGGLARAQARGPKPASMRARAARVRA